MKSSLVLLILVVLLSSSAQATGQSGLHPVAIRGQMQDVYVYPAQGLARGSVLFVPGDGGWRGFAIDIAQQISKWGYSVYGLDTKRYLESFTARTTLGEEDVMKDFRQLADWIDQGHENKISLVGWSEGAGLCLLAATAPQNQFRFSGLITLGLPEQNFLGWRLTDYLTWITKRMPNEPSFRSADHIQKVTPLPLWMLQSTKDEYVSLDKSRSLFAEAHEPKRFSAIEAINHRFDGNQSELFRLIEEGLRWLNG